MFLGPRFIHVLVLLLTSHRLLIHELGGTNVVVKGRRAVAAVAAVAVVVVMVDVVSAMPAASTV